MGIQTIRGASQWSKGVAELGKRGKPTHSRDSVYAAGELQKRALLKKAGLLQLLKLSLEKKRAFFPVYLRERSCSEARLEIRHRRIEDA